jgi:hypothetical protein
MSTAILNSLRYILNFDWLSGLPASAAKNIFLGLFVIIGILVLMIPNDYIYQGVEKRKWWLNLKLWALGDLALIFITYYIF